MSEKLKLEPTAPEKIWQDAYMAIKQCRHGTFLYNVNDAFIGRSLDLYGEWCEAELTVLGQVVRSGDVVLDVGANIGTHTVFFSKQVSDPGVVYAFEPQRLTFQNLCANCTLNALSNVLTRQVAVGDDKKTIRIPVFNPEREMNFGAIAMKEDEAGEPVEVIRIDDLSLRRCNLIKIDVEGMEPAVLKGAAETIQRLRPVLFVENNTREHSAEVIRTVESLGYNAFWHIRRYFNPDNYFGNSENVFARYQPEANMLCFHRSIGLNISGFEPVTGPDDNWRKAIQRIKDKAKSS
jgi:FkbM family methyltransferase